MSANTDLTAAEQAETSTVANEVRVGRFDVRERPELVLVPLTFVVVVAAWEIGVKVMDVAEYVLPPPSAIWQSLLRQVQSAQYWNNVWVTSLETLGGFAIGVVTAFVIGIAVAQFRLVEKTVFPYVVAFQTVPKTALAPLFVIWFGFGMSSKVVTAALVAFFPMLINVIEGLRATEQAQIELLRSLGATKSQIFRKVQLPNSMPFVFAGLDIGIVFAIIGAVVGEWVGAREGLGYQLLQYIYNFDIAGLFGVLVTLSVMGYAAHALIRAAQRKFAFWSESERTVAA